MEVESAVEVGGRGTGGRFPLDLRLLVMLLIWRVGIGVLGRGREEVLKTTSDGGWGGREAVEVPIDEEGGVAFESEGGGVEVSDAFLCRYSSIICSLSASNSAMRFLSSEISAAGSNEPDRSSAGTA